MASIDRKLSEKIQGLSVLCSVLVCFNHAYAVPPSIEYTSYFGSAVAILENFFRYGLSRISTPFFFMVSAYLLFREADTLWIRYGAEIRKRIRSLAVPFVLWSLWSFAIIACIQQIPRVMELSGRPSLIDLPFGSIARMLFWEPAAYPLWFVRDLFALICLAPLLNVLLRPRTRAWIVFLLCAVGWISYPEIKESRALLFFTLGAILAKHPVHMPITTTPARIALVVLWLGVSCINASLMTHCGHEITALTCLAIGTGLLAIWCAWDLSRLRMSGVAMVALAPYTFFVYAAHEPIEDLVRSSLLHVFGATPAAALAAFLITALLTFSACMAIAITLGRHANGFFSLIAGGRGPRKVCAPISGTTDPRSRHIPLDAAINATGDAPIDRDHPRAVVPPIGARTEMAQTVDTSNASLPSLDNLPSIRPHHPPNHVQSRLKCD